MTETVVSVNISSLEKNPWHFRSMSEKDFQNLCKEIRENGLGSISLPIIAEINKKRIIVDGHSRILAAQQAGYKKIPCMIAKSISDYHGLRIKTFHLNREGFSNPLLLSDMINEDMKLLNDIQRVAETYRVDEDYISSLLKIARLNDSTKMAIHRIIEVSKKKYQFLLQQLTPAHLASIADLEPKKQLEIADWLFRDIMYGPSDESMVSIPSVYEIIDEINKVTEHRESKTYKKKDKETHSKKEIPLECVCGAKYDIDAKSQTVYEYIEQNNIIIKKEFLHTKLKTRTYTSHNYTKSDLINAIKNAKSDDFRLVIFQRD